MNKIKFESLYATHSITIDGDVITIGSTENYLSGSPRDIFARKVRNITQYKIGIKADRIKDEIKLSRSLKGYEVIILKTFLEDYVMEESIA